MPLGVVAEIHEALPCSFSGMKTDAEAGMGNRGTYVIYLALLNARTGAVVDTVIAGNPQFSPQGMGTIVELRAGKQS